MKKKMKMVKVDKLPDHPSDLIDLALKDLAWVEKNNKTYKVEMENYWHMPNSHCSVCLAGSIIARSLHADPMVDINPGSFGASVRNKLEAVNLFRLGQVDDAFLDMGIYAERVDRFNDWAMPDYNPKKPELQKVLMEMADFLRPMVFVTHSGKLIKAKGSK